MVQRAIVAHGPRDFRFVEDHPIPVPGPLDVLIDARAVGICASDCKMFHGGAIYWVGSPSIFVSPRVNADVAVLSLEPSFDLAGKIVLVTGASSGIGEVCARVDVSFGSSALQPD